MLSARLRSVGAMLLSRTCPVCLRIGRAPCGDCAARLVPPPPLEPPPGLDRCVALFAYEGVGAELVAALKFANHRDAVRSLGVALASLVGDGHDVVTWVPASPARRRRNGFDHGEVLARAVAASVGAPCRRLLRRVDSRADGQTGRGRIERLAGPRLVGCATGGATGAGVLIVDDVRTTGASLRSAAAVLRADGARQIVGATFAATPERSRSRSSTIRSISKPPKGDRLCRSE
jgi:predicted amidophosphoribosyltransferase